MSIDDYLKKGQSIYAHRGFDDSRKETLSAHSERTRDYYQRLRSENHLSPDLLIRRLKFDEKPLTSDERKIVADLFDKAIYLHDIGKINSEFQRVKMKNFVAASDYKNSDHSLLSALLYLDICEEDLMKIKDDYLRAFIRYIAVVFSYVISRHHTYLEDLTFLDYIAKLNDLYEIVKQNPNILYLYERTDHLMTLKIVQRMEDGSSLYAERDDVCIDDVKQGSNLYLLMKLLYSCLVTSDFLATYYFFNREEAYFHYLDTKEKQKLLAEFQKTDICQGVERYIQHPDDADITPINRLHSRLFIETEKELARYPNQMIYYLEAPTGSGKTAVSVNLALHLLNQRQDLNKLLYVFPFNTLVEQTKTNLDHWFSGVEEDFRIQVVNSVTPIIREQEKKIDGEKESEEEVTSKTIDYNEEVLRRQMLQYPITITSHVNLFNHLFGVGKESHLGLATLANSVIILDEIQSYRNEIWPDMIRILNEVSKMYHIVFIIMSATLPKLDHLLCEQDSFTPLVTKRSDYFLNPIFRDRVHISFDLLRHGTLNVDAVVDEIVRIKKKHGKVRLLIEFIKKASARVIYEKLREIFPEEQRIIELTGDDSRYVRKKVLDKINGTNGQERLDDVILVATQVIEAGVDIDMDIGMKDISILDSEEQFLGRINRSGLKKDCWAYFFDMDEASSVYKQDLRLEKDLRDEHYQQALLTKDYEFFYEQVFQRFKQIREKRDKDYQKFDDMLNDLHFSEIAHHLTLIDEKNFSLVLNFEVRIGKGVKTGEEVWESFKQLLRDNKMGYAKKQVKLSQMTEKMDYFTFNVFQEPHYYDERIGNLYYVNDCEAFIEKIPELDAWRFLPDKYAQKGESSLL